MMHVKESIEVNVNYLFFFFISKFKKKISHQMERKERPWMDRVRQKEIENQIWYSVEDSINMSIDSPKMG